jgi:transposase, IS30 family
VPGHWEGDLIKGARNASAVGTLVERKSRYLILAKLDDATAAATLHAFRRRFRHVPPQLRKTLTYDQGLEMALHERPSRRLKFGAFVADPHSPWQRGTKKNMNGFIREYLPKGADLSSFSQAYLNDVARTLDNRPPKVLDYKTPAEAFAEDILKSTSRVALHV